MPQVIERVTLNAAPIAAMSWGSVSANGTPLNIGSQDWTVAKPGKGHYIITFNQPFAATPAISVTASYRKDTATAAIAEHDGDTSFSNAQTVHVRIRRIIQNPFGIDNPDAPFSFLVVGHPA